MNGQDIHFTQFYAAPLYLNPAFAGANVCSRVTMAYRNQWPGVSKTYNTFLFSADHEITQYNMGVGLLLTSDVAGTGNLTTTFINPTIAYGVRLTKQFALRAGFQPGMGIESVNFNKLLFGDQIARGGGVPTLETPTQTRVFFDMGAGALLYSSKYWIGAAFSHLANTNQSLINNGFAQLPEKYTIHGGAKIPLNEDESDDFKKKYITSAFNFSNQQNFNQLDIGFYYTQYVFNIGIWYRGIPLSKTYANYVNNDAFAFLVGVQTGRLNIGYSYDMTVSRLQNSLSYGANELTLSYQLCKLHKRKPKYGLMLPCPKF